MLTDLLRRCEEHLKAASPEVTEYVLYLEEYHESEDCEELPPEGSPEFPLRHVVLEFPWRVDIPQLCANCGDPYQRDHETYAPLLRALQEAIKYSKLPRLGSPALLKNVAGTHEYVYHHFRPHALPGVIPDELLSDLLRAREKMLAFLINYISDRKSIYKPILSPDVSDTFILMHASLSQIMIEDFPGEGLLWMDAYLHTQRTYAYILLLPKDLAARLDGKYGNIVPSTLSPSALETLLCFTEDGIDLKEAVKAARALN